MKRESDSDRTRKNKNVNERRTVRGRWKKDLEKGKKKEYGHG